MTGRTGYDAPNATFGFNPPDDMTDIYEHFDPLIGETVSTSTSLPSSGNWTGRSIYVADIDALVVWNGTGWKIRVPAAGGLSRIMSATNNFSNKLTYTVFPNATDVAALTSTYVKRSGSTRLMINIMGTSQLSAGANQNLWLGIRFNSTDYDVARRFFTSGTRQEYVGVAFLTGVAAGSFTVQPVFKAAVASSVDFFADDFVAYTIQEVQ